MGINNCNNVTDFVFFDLQNIYIFVLKAFGTFYVCYQYLRASQHSSKASAIEDEANYSFSHAVSHICGAGSEC